MTYFEGFIVPVPEANRDAYRKTAQDFANLVRDLGVQRQVEAWDSDVPEGKVTDFRKAVDAKPDEKIVFSWFEYPDRATRDSTNQKFRDDPKMAEPRNARGRGDGPAAPPWSAVDLPTVS